MRVSLLLAACAAFLLAPSVSAQKVVKSWYQFTSGGKVQVIQADRVVMRRDGRTLKASFGRREIVFTSPVSIVFRGTGAEPTAYGGRSGSSQTTAPGQHTTTETVIGFDGTSTTKVTTTTTDPDTANQTTSTTTITTTADGETTVETTDGK